MKRVYLCPKCESVLNPNVKIILTATKGKKRGLLLLSPQPGNYRFFAAPELELADGEKVEFHCPVCRVSLACHADPNLAELSYRTESGQ